ncbi:hypothetical protein [Streptomyces hirsutus]|uniref:hypothetical protein n=1 Tax=Streptomyces hirsutus TaxID=35620 RepID=UPI00364E4AD0
MKAQSYLDKVIELLSQEEDATIKAHLRAALVLKLSAAKLPELNGVLKSVDPVSVPGANEALSQQQSESPAS